MSVNGRPAATAKKGREHLFELRLTDRGDLRGVVDPDLVYRALVLGFTVLDGRGEMEGRSLEDVGVELMS